MIRKIAELTTLKNLETQRLECLRATECETVLREFLIVRDQYIQPIVPKKEILLWRIE